MPASSHPWKSHSEQPWLEAPNPPRRANMEVKAGRVQLIWDVVTSEMAGNDDLEAFGVEYDVWGKPYPLDLTSTWRRLYQLPSYEAKFTPGGWLWLEREFCCCHFSMCFPYLQFQLVDGGIVLLRQNSPHFDKDEPRLFHT